MGANGFLVCYGLRWQVGAGEVDLLERRQDPRQLAAKRHKLQSWWGVTTDQRTYFLLVGRLVGNFGWEGDHAARLTDAEAAAVVGETKARLKEAGFEEEPAWHYQFEPDY